MRRQLEHQERLATGQLAASVARDFNGFLASITLHTQLSLRSPVLTAQLEERMHVTLAEANSAAHLVQQILDFSRRAAIERKPLALLPLLQKQIELLKRTLPEHVAIELVYGDEEYTIDADRARVHQAVANLALNARGREAGDRSAPR